MMKYLIIPVTPYQQNCSLVWCEMTRSAALIDPGGETTKLLQQVENNKLNLEKIMLTHGHLDHVGAALEISKKLNIPIIGPHKDDIFWLELIPQQTQMFNFPPNSSFTPDQWLNEGDVVNVGEISFSVLHCPGHTPGHVIFFDSESKTAFVGDVLFKGSVGRSDFPQGDHHTLISSINNKLLPLGDDVIFIPGHGPNSTFGHERRTNPFLV